MGLLSGIFGSSDPADYQGRESASDRAQRRTDEQTAARRASTARAHRRSATRLDREVAAAEDRNRATDSAPARGRRWW